MTVRSIVLCERAVQAANIEAAVGLSFGIVRATLGVLLRLQRPDEIRPAWKKWTNDNLMVPEGYGLIPLDGLGKIKRLDELRDVLSRADTVYVVGQAGSAALPVMDVLKYVAFGGTVVRIDLLAEDLRSVRKAFAAPAVSHPGLRVKAAELRREFEQAYNLTLTRCATNILRSRRPGLRDTIGIGLLRSPVLDWICQREFEIETFQRTSDWAVGAYLDGGMMVWHEPEDGRLFATRVEAEIFAERVLGEVGMLARRQWIFDDTQMPWDLPTMQRVGTDWGWTVARTSKIARSLYERSRLITWPATDCQYWPKAHLPMIYGVIERLRGIDVFRDLLTAASVEVNWFNDDEVAAHGQHAVGPNPEMVDFGRAWAGLDADERRLFKAICDGWIAAIARGPERTAWRVSFETMDGVATFGAVGQGRCPVALDREAVIEGIKLEERVEAPPDRYTEGEIVALMRDPHSKMRGARGRMGFTLGTPGARADVIETLKAQGLISVVQERLRPTAAGRSVHALVLSVAPEVFDVGLVAEFDDRLQSLREGTVTETELRKELSDRLSGIIARMTASLDLKVA